MGTTGMIVWAEDQIRLSSLIPPHPLRYQTYLELAELEESKHFLLPSLRVLTKDFRTQLRSLLKVAFKDSRIQGRSQYEVELETRSSPSSTRNRIYFRPTAFASSPRTTPSFSNRLISASASAYLLLSTSHST